MFRSRLGAALRGLDKLEQGLRGLASGASLERVADRMQARGQQLVRSVFRTSKQPDGTPMAPLTYRIGRPLVLTGELEAGARCIVVSVGERGILLLFEVQDTGEVKAIWHQKGTFRGGPTSDARRPQNRKSGRGSTGIAERAHIPPRKMLPENAGEAARWISDLEKAGQAELDRIVRPLGF